MNGLNTHTHRNGLQTEVDAFVKASKRMDSTKLKIIFEIGCAGANGLTPDEFVEIHGGLINTVRRRFTDLWKEGKIKHHPILLERKNRAGNNCVTWVIGKDEKSVPRKSKRPWVGLTDEEINQGLLRSNYAMQTAGAWRDGVEWAIKQLKEKNT